MTYWGHRRRASKAAAPGRLSTCEGRSGFRTACCSARTALWSWQTPHSALDQHSVNVSAPVVCLSKKKMRAHIYGIYRAGLVWLRNFSLRPVVATSLFSNLGLLANVVRLSTFVATHRAFSGADKLRTPRGYVIRLLVIFILSHLHPFNRNSTWLVTSRHHTSSPCILAQEKVVLWRDVTRRVALVGQHGATRTARQARHAAEARVRRSSISSKQPSNVLL